MNAGGSGSAGMSSILDQALVLDVKKVAAITVGKEAGIETGVMGRTLEPLTPKVVPLKER